MPGDQFAQRESELNAKRAQFEEAGDTAGVERVDLKLQQLADKRARMAEKGEAKATKKATKSTKRSKK